MINFVNVSLVYKYTFFMTKCLNNTLGGPIFFPTFCSSTISKMRGAQMGVWKSRNPESGIRNPDSGTRNGSRKRKWNLN